MKRIVTVKPRPGYRVWLKFSDGVEGEADLSHLAGKGVFEIWRDVSVFEQVKAGEFGELTWKEGVDLCADSLYLQVTGKGLEEISEKSSSTASHA